MREILAKPTPEMLAWSELELGVFFHYDLEVFAPEDPFRSEELILSSVWNPTELDTDQWIRMAKDAGARYAILTAKHGTGFCLWPTRFHDYHVGNAPVKTDVVGAFVNSCRKYGLKPALYFSLNSRHLEKICRKPDGTQDQEKKNQILLGQVEELIRAYGPLSEIWFDGGVLRQELGGPDIPGLLNRIAPELPVFGGCPGLRNVIRWSGSEQGVALEDCWSAAHFLTDPARRNVTCDSPGDPFDPVWAPAEVDMPVRDVMYAFVGGWMYHKDDADMTYSAEYLFERYLTSVGRNANLTIGCVPDTRGLISDDQVESFTGLGALIREHLGTPAGETTEMLPGKTAQDTGEPTDLGSMELWFSGPVDAEYIELKEDQTEGQRILSYVVETRWPDDWCGKEGTDTWIPVAKGQSIGHKRLIRIGHLRGYAFRVRILDGAEGAKLQSFRLYGKKFSFPTDRYKKK